MAELTRAEVLAAIASIDRAIEQERSLKAATAEAWSVLRGDKPPRGAQERWQEARSRWGQAQLQLVSLQEEHRETLMAAARAWVTQQPADEPATTAGEEA